MSKIIFKSHSEGNAPVSVELQRHFTMQQSWGRPERGGEVSRRGQCVCCCYPPYPNKPQWSGMQIWEWWREGKWPPEVAGAKQLICFFEHMRNIVPCGLSCASGVVCRLFWVRIRNLLQCSGWTQLELSMCL